MNLFGGKTRHSLQAQKNISTLVENVIGVPQGGCKKRVNINVDALLASKVPPKATFICQKLSQSDPKATPT